MYWIWKYVPQGFNVHVKVVPESSFVKNMFWQILQDELDTGFVYWLRNGALILAKKCLTPTE